MPSNEHYEASPGYDRIPPYDPRSGEHFWIQLVSFRVNPSIWKDKQLVHLDRENLVQISAPGCYYCERVWTKKADKTRCPGEA